MTKTRSKQSEIIFPKREATVRDVARFSAWCGIDIRVELTPRPKRDRRKKVDPKKPRA